MKKILVFSGAGIDKESGINTFRDNDGIWHEFNVNEVASIHGWMTNPQKVIDFYNQRRREMNNALPNDAHKVIASLEDNFDVTISTQNVSNLHKKAGSKNVINLHGDLSKLCSEINRNYKRPYDKDLKLGDYCPDGGHMRPDIIWFGEELNYSDLEKTKKSAQSADICIIIGTSMMVSPANEIPWITKDTCLIYYVDPGEVGFNIPSYRKPFFTHIKKVATEGIIDVKNDLETIFL